MTQDESVALFRTVYRALSALGDEQPQISTAAVASLRLLLIDQVGESEQSKLIGAWNAELERR
jgi:hypothetical protein